MNFSYTKRLLPRDCYSRLRQNIDTMVIHYISAVNVDENRPFEVDLIYDILSDYNVSYNHLVDRSGGVVELVPIHCTAWHAGKSHFEGRDNVNSFSLGVALIGGPQWDFTDDQYLSLAKLTKRYMTATDIRLNHIVGHDYISPDRKVDPGKRFLWSRYLNLVLEMHRVYYSDYNFRTIS